MGRKSAPVPLPDDHESSIRSNGTKIPLNIVKIAKAIEDRGLDRNRVQEQAGLFENRINEWITGAGEMTVKQAWALSEAIDIPFSYIVDDGAKLITPDPPRRSSYKNTNFIELAEPMQLNEKDIANGLPLLMTCKDHDVDFALARQYVIALADERKALENPIGFSNKSIDPNGTDGTRKKKKG